MERALAALRGIEVAGGAAPGCKETRKADGFEVQRGSSEADERGAAAKWAKKKAKKKAPARKKSGGMTAAGRKRLSELMKARWASKNPPKAVGKKRR